MEKITAININFPRYHRYLNVYFHALIFRNGKPAMKINSDFLNYGRTIQNELFRSFSSKEIK